MNPNMAGEDASLDSAVAAITAKLRGGVEAERRDDPRENRDDRDVIERDLGSGLEESERIERESQAAEETDGKAPAEDESEGGAEAAAEDDAQFIELPPAEEGAEPERVPVAEAVEAVKQLRQMNGEIATAVIRAEEEAFAKQDKITQALSSTFETVAQQAKTALQMMHVYAPQPPDPILLDESSGYYDPAHYHKAKIQYDNFVQHYQKVQATLKQAEEGRATVGWQQDVETMRRETERAARFIPEFKDEKTRAAKVAEYLEVLGPRYGITKEMLEEIGDHRGWRIVNDLSRSLKAEKKAPEVKKHLTETKPKIVNGRVSPTRDPNSGQFVSKARQELKEHGSEDAFARLLMRSGALKNL